MMEQSIPLVSVVIPARNEEAAIEAALERVLQQTYPLDCIEVVVVDGNSTDDTGARAKAILASAPLRRSAVVLNEQSTTPSNLNVGLQWAAGEILIRVDSRSLIPADYVERLVTVLTDPSIAVAGGSQVAIARSQSLKDRAIARALNNRYAMGGSSYRSEGSPSGPVDTVYLGSFRTAQLREEGGWNEEFSTNQDFELNRRMAKQGDVWFESGLPVGYLGREQLRQIWHQYHRFGRWKARYWQTTGDRPQPRQVVLVAAPPLAVAGAVAIWSLAPRLVLGAAIAAPLLVDAIGGERPHKDLGTRGFAGIVNVVVGLAWWSGVVAGSADRSSHTFGWPSR